MKRFKWMFAAALGVCLLSGTPVLAQGNGNGHGKGHNKHADDGEDRGGYQYNHHEREIRAWYSQSESHLPLGLAKKDRLPPGLEKQLVRNGTLPPGLQKRLYPAPAELESQLPPPPPGCAHVLVGGNLVLLNRKTNLIVDVFVF